MKRDRGLAAVARVRSVREQESQRALQRALAEARERRRDLTELEHQISAAAGMEADLFGTDGLSAPGRLLALRTTLTNLGQLVGEARQAVVVAERATDLARGQWEQDKTRLTAVERLLERRLAERRAELARAHGRESDELASAGWIRRTQGDA